MKSSYESLKKIKNNKILVIYILIGILLNQSSVIGGVNISFADIAIFVLFIGLAMKREFNFRKVYFLFFLCLLIVSLVTTVYITPNRFGIKLNYYSLVANYVKLIAVFLYFFVGMNMKNMDYVKVMMKSFSYMSLLIGLVGMMYALLDIRFMRAIFMEYGARFKGFMNDPNYFAIIQLSAMSYFIVKKDISLLKKSMYIGILIFSIILSGSKTGFVVMGILLLFSFVIIKISIKWFVLAFLLLGIILMIIVNPEVVTKTTNGIVGYVPSFERVQYLFINFVDAISQGGSSRSDVWGNGLRLIKESPILGIGVGTYSSVTYKLFQSNSIAHNTYIQLIVEWGMLMSTIAFAAVFFNYVKVFLIREKSEVAKIILNVGMVFFVASLAISLNNARIFWLLFGVTSNILKSERGD